MRKLRLKGVKDLKANFFEPLHKTKTVFSMVEHINVIK